MPIAAHNAVTAEVEVADIPTRVVPVGLDKEKFAARVAYELCTSGLKCHALIVYSIFAIVALVMDDWVTLQTLHRCCIRLSYCLTLVNRLNLYANAVATVIKVASLVVACVVAGTNDDLLVAPIAE